VRAPHPGPYRPVGAENLQTTGAETRAGSRISPSNLPSFHQSSIMFQKSISEEF